MGEGRYDCRTVVLTRPDIVERALGSDRLALARLISIVEDGSEELASVMAAVFPQTGNAYTVGITGSPGTGKSTLTEALISKMRAEDKRVAVLAVDPSSAFSGGALLGDRVRMQTHAIDQDVFIRSMATRGHLGGLALATPEAARVLDAAGYGYIIIETVGVGQAEIDIVDAADTTVVVLNPGWGDSVQAGKAGLMEIADVFAINKADREGVKQTVREVRQMLTFAKEVGGTSAWVPPVRETIATRDEGVAELWEAIKQHRGHLESSGELQVRRRSHIAKEISNIVAERVRSKVQAEAVDLLDPLVARVLAREIDPYAAASALLDTLDVDGS